MATAAEAVRTYTADEIARFFLYLVSQDEDAGEVISNLRLQKLVYYAQGFSLALRGQPLFVEPIEAWVHGPVVPALFHAYQVYGRHDLPAPEHFDSADYDPETRELLYDVYRTYGRYSAWALRDLTREEPPFRQTPPGEIIDLGAMRAYFRTQIDGDAAPV
jgi:uncharacterized phage-associated protein